jgi:hypothetical protein
MGKMQILGAVFIVAALPFVVANVAHQLRSRASVREILDTSLIEVIGLLCGVSMLLPKIAIFVGLAIGLLFLRYLWITGRRVRDLRSKRQ